MAYYDPVSENDAQALQFIEDVTRDAASVQKRVLAEILSQNADTEYLKRFNLSEATDRETFKSKVPVVTYDNLQVDVLRIANGDRSPIFSSHPVSEFHTSSGTSGGERKLMPTIDEEMDRRHLLFSLLMPLIKQDVPDLDDWKALRFLFLKSGTKTPGGIAARPGSTSYYTSEQFKKRPFESYTSPNEVIECTDSFQSLYAQMLCGLIMRHQVQRVGAIFASGFLRALKFLQNNYHQLGYDISTGTLTSQITDVSIRKCIENNILKPDPELGEFILKECSKENWERIITRIWPNAKYLDVIVTGAMAQYIPTLDYYSGGLPIVCTMYASSECFFGPNLKPFCNPSEVSYLILPNMGYFEFLPLDDSSLSASSPDLVDLADVEVGKEYELVVTTYAGLYRYRIGDVLRVTGFHNSAPEFQFVGRRNVLLSIDLDKTDETSLQKAVDNASLLLKELNTSVVEYTSYADIKSLPGHYVIYWELLAKDHPPSSTSVGPTDEVLNRCCLAMEESLDAMYRQGRVEYKSIGPLEIRVVKNGTFEELMDYAISRGASISQYKATRCVNSTPMLELLDSRVVSVHISPLPPHWAAGGRRLD
ncbi:hypothetical protein QN277_003675 [Acacia crassicarpa]|uniref:Uncharacterized protein n=1 Tax=Acacia crassicarpa TaxID=499986 RepID=A0AAE1J2N9_9FABA|nr:hypothetical protein QN277_003675 [Acacia crassicarpa]